jgi:DNA-binding NtrC family response regulator
MKIKTILVVDDDSQIRDALAKVLRAEGYGVALAGDTEETRVRYDSERIDLLLLDLNLPQTNGWDLFEWLTFANPLLPIIIITGRTNQYRLAAASGASALMEKPLNVPLLLQTIADLLAEPSENRLKRLTGRESLLRYSGAGATALPVSGHGRSSIEQLRSEN